LAMILRGSWQLSSPNYLWMGTGGLVAGCALSLNQSAFDAFLIGLVVVLYFSVRGSWTTKDRWLALPATLAGFLVSVGAMVVHGAVVGMSVWWDAVVGFRSANVGILSGANFPRLRSSVRMALPAILLLGLVLIALAVWSLRKRRLVVRLFALWMFLAGIAFVSGGLFWRHYWLVLFFPAGTALGALLPKDVPHKAQKAAVIIALLPPMLLGIRGGFSPGREAPGSLNHSAEHIATWYSAHSGPADRIYAQCNGQELYAMVRSDPPFAYLWPEHITPVRSRRKQLADLLLGPDAPRYIVEFQPPDECDPSGVMETVLATRYQQVVVIDGVPIYERKPGA
ncbi:MAG: hypothetical protein WCH93_10105, partial [Actinomycetota bacterium]